MITTVYRPPESSAQNILLVKAGELRIFKGIFITFP